MLKGICPLLSAELLHALAAMGHGDEIAVVDRNFPAASTNHRVVTLFGPDVVSVGEAICSLFPLDTFVESPLHRMEVVDKPNEIPEVQRIFHNICEKAEGRTIAMGSLDREEFYERTRLAFAVVATTEARPYGCFLLTKGVIND
jgi:L-fucose mutarotase